MLRRDMFLELIRDVPFSTKMGAYLVESGPAGLTRKMFHRGLSVLVVGRNGRGYMPNWWVDSRTFRLREQSNLLVHDNVTRAFDEMPFPEKQGFARRTWGHFLDEGSRV
jgi:hypothetical protein